MGALCKAVLDDVIHVESLDEKIIKLLNSPTNTLSQSKLKYVLNVVHETQPRIKCIITIMTPDMKDTLFEVEYHQPDAIDFLDTIKLNLFAQEIFVFTPKGEIKTLPQNSTALDFAFSLHTEIGCHCI